MSQNDDQFTLIESKLSGFITQDSMTIEVCIYRGDAERTWRQCREVRKSETLDGAPSEQQKLAAEIGEVYRVPDSDLD